jgi:hypothetical protein
MSVPIASVAAHGKLRQTPRARPQQRSAGAAFVIMALSFGPAWAAPATRAPDPIAGSWRGTWTSVESRANGRFSATLSTKPAWWGDVEIVGTLNFRGLACAGTLSVSGSYFRGHEYLLTAKGHDGTIRVTSAVTVTDHPPRSLAGHYDVVPSGTGCRSDSGRVDAARR